MESHIDNYRHNFETRFTQGSKKMKTMPILVRTMAVLAMLSMLPAVDNSTPTPKGGEGQETDLLGNVIVSMSKQEAEALVAQGKQAMIDSNDNPSLSVEAAIAFSKALRYYEKEKDIDKICDLEANIFWCKKRMNLDNVKSFLAQKNGDKVAEAALAKADQVAKKEVSTDKAQEYFTRAEKFAAKHPNQHDQISVRYFEVAERFVGTEIGIKAQKLSLAAQQEHMKQLKEEQEAARQTLFVRPVKLKSGIKDAALPSPDDQKAAMSQLKDLYKADFSRRKPNQKRNFAEKLMDQARSTKDDPVMLHALLTAAIDLAGDCDDFATVLEACDRMAIAFAGVDAKEQKKAVFGRLRTNDSNARAIYTLLDEPDNAEANTTAGMYFCFEVGKWEAGLPMLLHGSDETLKKLAEMELVSPGGAAQQMEIADKWYEVGKKGRNATKYGPYTRAMMWYQKAETKITGISKDRIKKRLDEIDSALPLTNLDYNNLTVKQWERLKGKTVGIYAGRDRNNIGLQVVPGRRYRLVPHPTDTWTTNPGYYSSSGKTVTWKGYEARENEYITPGEYPEGTMVMQVEHGKWMKVGIVEGSGRVFVGPYSREMSGAYGTGTIRCKIIPADDE